MEKIWKPVYNYEGLYEISNYGEIKSIDRIVKSKSNRLCKGKILKQVNDKYGYQTIQLHKNGKRSVFFIHRLVMLTFIGNEAGKSQVNHKNGNKSDNKLINLEWMTPSENTKHAWKTGLAKKLN
jgi:hypothetical protein